MFFLGYFLKLQFAGHLLSWDLSGTHTIVFNFNMVCSIEYKIEVFSNTNCKRQPDFQWGFHQSKSFWKCSCHCSVIEKLVLQILNEGMY
jgi:hypothetical protein